MVLDLDSRSDATRGVGIKPGGTVSSRRMDAIMTIVTVKAVVLRQIGVRVFVAIGLAAALGLTMLLGPNKPCAMSLVLR